MPRATEWKARAASLIDQGELGRAEDMLAMGLGSDPTPFEQVWIRLGLALICRATDRIEEADEHLEAAFASEEDLMRLGEALFLAEAPELAALTFEHAARRHPHDGQAMRFLGHARATAGDLEGAVRAFEQAIVRDVSDVTLRYELALALHQAGDLRRAASQLHIVLQGQPRHAEARVLKADIAFGLGEYRQAIVDYEQAIKLPGVEPIVFESLAWACVLVGHTPRAATTMAACVKAHPTHWPGYLLAGRLFEGAGRFALARRYFHAASWVDEFRAEAVAALERLEGREEARPLERLPARPASLTARLGPQGTRRLELGPTQPMPSVSPPGS